MLLALLVHVYSPAVRTVQHPSFVSNSSKVATGEPCPPPPVDYFRLLRSFGERVRPAKAGMFSGRQSYRGKSQMPLSLGRIGGGNETEEADRPSHPQEGERVIGP